MAEDEVRIRVTADADEAVKGLTDTAKASEKLTKEMDESSRASQKNEQATESQARELHKLKDATDQSAKSTKDASAETMALGKAKDALKGAAAGLIATYIGSMGLNEAIQAYNERLEKNNRLLEENAQLTRAAAEAALDLQFMSAVPDFAERDFAMQQAVLAGRDPKEGLQAFGQLKSRNPNASPEELRGTYQLMMAQAQQTTASGQALVNLYDVAGKMTGGDPLATANLVSATIEQAGEIDPSNIAPLLGSFSSVGMNVGGLTAGETAGFVAGGSNLNLPGAVAITGLKNAVLSIRGKGTPEGAQVLDRENIDRKDVKLALQQLSDARVVGRISDAELEAIGGKEAVPVFAELADPETLKRFLASVSAVDTATRSDRLLLADKSSSHFAQDAMQRLNLAAKQAESFTTKERSGDTRAQEADVGLQVLRGLLQKARNEGRVVPAEIEAAEEHYRHSIARGFDPADAARMAQLGTKMDQFDLAPGVDAPLGQGVREALRFGPAPVLTGDQAKLSALRARSMQVARAAVAQSLGQLRLNGSISEFDEQQILAAFDDRALPGTDPMDVVGDLGSLFGASRVGSLEGDVRGALRSGQLFDSGINVNINMNVTPINAIYHAPVHPALMRSGVSEMGYDG